MDAWVFAAVLTAAAMHAGWNTLVKSADDAHASITLVTTGACILAIACLPFVAVPHPRVWPLLAASVLLHVCYNLSLVQAYRTGDLGQVYPMARGTAPLIVAIATALLLGEWLTPAEMIGTGVLLAGVWLMSLRGGRAIAGLDRRALRYALATAVFIAGYTLADGLGARQAGSAASYVVWLFMLDGLAMLVIFASSRGRVALRHIGRHWPIAAVGGLMSVGAYWVAVWAMTKAPIALVAALRETSVLFAAVISVAILREVLNSWRLLATAMILCGIVLMRVG